MPNAFYICAGITALFLIFTLAKISYRLYEIHMVLTQINVYMLKFSIREQLKSEPVKKREYWRDQNGFRHWRKKTDA